MLCTRMWRSYGHVSWRTHWMLPSDVHANTLLLPVLRLWMSPFPTLTSRWCRGTARLMSHWRTYMQVQSSSRINTSIQGNDSLQKHRVELHH